MNRTLVKRNVAKAVKRALKDGSDEPDDGLKKGYMRLYSFYTPSLEAGPYAIEAKQEIHVKGGTDTLQIWNYLGESKVPTAPIQRQNFTVIAPQFSIDDKLINAYYPPSGHQDEERILPHITFNDPHVPWMRRAGVFYDFLKQPFDNEPAPTPESSPGPARSMVPWMAVVVFRPDELLVSPQDAQQTGLDQGINSYVPGKLPANGAFVMTVADYLNKIKTHRIYYEAGGDDSLKTSKEITSIIFPTKKLVQQIFGTSTEPEKVRAQKLMAHVRHINTLGFPDAGVEEEGYFSEVISSRTGKIEGNVPTTQIAHLVSFEHWDTTCNLTGNKEFPFENITETERIGLVSLFSWTYTCIPETVDLRDALQNLASHKQPLRPPDTILENLKQSINIQNASKQKATLALYDRLNLSYTISRWRVASGEETAAFNRGPLVAAPNPATPSPDPSDWPALSMSGKEYQILDTKVGMMDLTYSSAWSLGHLVGISDSPFNAALLRFRSLVSNTAASNTNKFINRIAPAADILAKTSQALQIAKHISFGNFEGKLQRNVPQSTEPVAPPLTHPSVLPILNAAIRNAVDTTTSIADGTKIYSDYDLDTAASSDWELIHGWISDCLYFKHIPAHYLFPELSHISGPPAASALPSLPNVPPEAFRFFYVDHSWVDAFIDGALSCANHMPNGDPTRLRIKDVYNFYLSTPIHGLEKKVPPVPRYGFVLRSLIVKAVPDLKITVTCWKFNPSGTTPSSSDSSNKVFWLPDLGENRHDPVVQLTKMDDFTLLCLLDCLPEQIHEIRIAQPPHQQRFAIGEALEPVDGVLQAKLPIRMLYTSDDTSGTDEDGTWPYLPDAEKPTDQATYYNPDTQLINPQAIADSIQRALTNSKKYSKLYTDPIANSCLLGLELNDPCYTLIIHVDQPQGEEDFAPWIRQLWTGLEGAKQIPHDPTAVLTAEVHTDAPMVKLNQIKLIEAHAETSHPTIPASSFLRPAPLLHSARVIPRMPFMTAAVVHPANVGGAIDSQFTLIIHVDYRPPPPTPLRTQTDQIIHAPMDYLPTDTTYLYDLIIAVRRRAPNVNPNLRLAQLDIELPVSDGIDAPQPRTGIREPLFPPGGYNGPGVRMTGNFRFVPTLYSDLDKDKKPIQGITLIPRSGEKDATILLSEDRRTREASIRLSQCRIADIKDTNARALIAQAPGTEPASLPAGICKVLLRETYKLDDGSKRIVVTDGNLSPKKEVIPLRALKRANLDKDLS